MAKPIMIQGTMSSAGKSLIVAGLCRVLKQDGYRVAPFKSQNMALNSFITEDGLEMGRAQVMQAEAAGIKPSVLMNPILLKPTNDMGSQVIVHGEIMGNMSAQAYFEYRKNLLPDIRVAYETLAKDYNIIVIEGAGSPAEINLKKHDIVNMGMAELVDAPVLLVGDIDRGGVFAQLVGTLMLLEETERHRIKGLIINKFRGDRSILAPGIEMLEERSGKPVVGVIPYIHVSIEDEDSVTTRFDKRKAASIDIAVIRFPRISNFTDFDVLERFEDVSLRYVQSANDLGQPDMIILPGSKNTMGDLKWLRQNGLEVKIKQASKSCVVFGICGGYQMLGQWIADPHQVEEGGEMHGLELLPIHTTLQKEKIRRQVTGNIRQIGGTLQGLAGMDMTGYEIHMGISEMLSDDSQSMCQLYDKQSKQHKVDGVSCNNIYGTYVHGIFDHGELALTLVQALATKKKVVIRSSQTMDYTAFKETQYDKLADALREHLDMEAIYQLLRE